MMDYISLAGISVGLAMDAFRRLYHKWRRVQERRL